MVTLTRAEFKGATSIVFGIIFGIAAAANAAGGQQPFVPMFVAVGFAFFALGVYQATRPGSFERGNEMAPERWYTYVKIVFGVCLAGAIAVLLLL
ncbi:MAG: hypothetical protein PPP58_03905 [Natronomonas sp.]